jgi:hypothetical protein
VTHVANAATIVSEFLASRCGMKGSLMDFYLDEDLMKTGAEQWNVKEIK